MPCVFCVGGFSTEGPVEFFNRGSNRDQRDISAQEEENDLETGRSTDPGKCRDMGSASSGIIT
jgi:hypothetical protein